MAEDGTIFVGGGGEGHAVAQELLLRYANRHGLIAGATGTGKTVTLQILAEGLSEAGVPVFMADVKGDLSGLCQAGAPEGKLAEAFAKRAAAIGWQMRARPFPVLFWDIFGERGHPVRTTVAEMGPLLLSRLLELSEAQEGVLNVAFRLADEERLALLDYRDLQALLTFVAEHAAEVSARYGLVSRDSAGAILRRLLVLENEGGARLFGEPALAIADLMRVNGQGEGTISILSAERLMNSPRLYATFLLWLLSELFETLPEVGDPDKPRLVFFFDEAHLLFRDAPRALVAKVEQVARLIRSKGVGVWFVTQNPADVPDAILGQLGNRIQHALRAFTAKDQKDLRLAAQNYRPNPRFAIEDAIREVGTGEAVTSLLEAKGVPGMAERTLVRPPMSRLGPADDSARAAVLAASPLRGRYDTVLDRESAWEILRARAGRAASAAAGEVSAGDPAGVSGGVSGGAGDEFARARRFGAGASPRPATGGAAAPASSAPASSAPAPSRPPPAAEARPRPAARQSDSIADTLAKSFARQIGTAGGRAVVRGLFGTLFGKR